MNTIVLNHGVEPHKIKIMALVLLVMGGLINAGLFLYHQNLANRTHLLEAEIQQMTQVATPSKFIKVDAQTNSNSREESNAVNAAIIQISLPWVPLFKALEATSNDTVKLLAVEPNPKKGHLRISAVALDIDGMMVYVGDLSQQKIFKDVTLLSQETIEVNGKMAVQFMVETGWKI